MRRPIIALAGALWLTLMPSAQAASFDAEGRLTWDDQNVAHESFESDQATISCEQTCSYEDVTADSELALEGKHYLQVNTNQDPLEVDLTLPKTNASYRFTAWVRHARVWARMVFDYDDAARGTEAAWMYPTGRVTSDGWVELASNPSSVTGPDLSRAFFRIEGSAVDVDAIEAVPDGEYDGGEPCAGAFDPVCGSEALCISGRCRQGARYVPVLPPEAYRGSVARYLHERLEDFFGGAFSRKHYLPAALARLDEMKTATTPWQYWNAFGHAVRLLHDWHTSATSPIAGGFSDQRLGVCFIEGVADLSQSVWPSQAGRSDILVSHVGPDGTLGLVPGDRLVAVDGLHPVDWVLSIVGANWGHHVATDITVDADLVEELRDLIPRFARSFSVIRCDPATLTCSDTVETLSVDEIQSGIQAPACDNRPSYHLENPPEQTPGDIEIYHHVPFWAWRDLVVDSAPGENIYGMTFDYLYGTAQGLTPVFLDDNTFFKANARGLILDHRAGNGGTIDAPEAITQLVRTPAQLSVSTFMTTAAYDGPTTPAEGAALYQQLLQNGNSTYNVGSNAPDLALPVALLLHRDGSASDWLPHGMKGAPNVRIFGPHQTAGAFSSFYQFSYWSRFEFQLASGDTYLPDGTPLLGHGIEPDEIVEHSQSSLLQGKDAIYDAGLAWVRSHLKP
jgi:Peptidase family S41